MLGLCLVVKDLGERTGGGPVFYCYSRTFKT